MTLLVIMNVVCKICCSMSVIYVIPQYILLFYEINTLGEVSVGKVDYSCVENSIKICNQQKKK